MKDLLATKIPKINPDTFIINGKHSTCNINARCHITRKLLRISFGISQTMQNLTAYDDVVSEVFDELLMKAERMQACGVRAERIVLDPGFGFAKTLEQNYTLLRCLSRLCEAGYPVLVGVSRKSMITRLLDISSDEALCGTQVLGWEALRQGASILRVHDVREAMHTVKMYEAYIKR
jgi:dihydropteroate synthase